MLSTVADHHHWSGFLGDFPYEGIGSALISTAIVVLVFEVILREDSERRTLIGVNNAVSQIQAGVHGALIREMQVGSADLSEVVNEGQLDLLIRRALETRSGEKQMAQDVYGMLDRQLLQAEERWTNMVVTADVTPIGADEEWFPGEVSADDYFSFHLNWRYRGVLKSDHLTFASAATQEIYNAMIRSATYDYVFRYPPSIPQALTKYGVGMTVSSASVNGEDLQLVPSPDGSVVATSSNLAELVGSEVDVSYSIRTLTRRDAHVITFEIPRPCRDVQYTLHFDSNTVQAVRMLDFFSTDREVQISHFPNQNEPQTVILAVNGWVFPKSGFSAVWTLRDED